LELVNSLEAIPRPASAFFLFGAERAAYEVTAH
jgi:hypothetical protein